MNNRQVNLAQLRARAEAAIEGSRQQLELTPAQGAENEIRHLVEELRIYQTELEIQNQELISAQSDISLALEKYRVLFENLPLPGILVDDQGFIVEANQQASRFLGLRTNVALQRRSVHQLFDADSRSKLYGVMRDRSNLVPQTIDLLNLKVGEQQTVPCDVHIIHLGGEADQAARTLLVLVDQTTEMALRESENNFRSLADSSTALIWASGRDTLYNYVNLGWLNFTGRSLAQELGEGWRDSIHPDDVDHHVTNYLGHFEQRKAYSIDYRIRRHDGEYRWIRDNATPRYDTNGQFIGYIGHGLDITDRVLAESQLRKLSKAVEQSPQSIVITDRNATIEYVNAACVASTGYSAAELIGQNPRILNSGQTPPEVYASLWERLHQGQAWAGQFSNRRKNGDIYYEHVRIAPIRDEAGETTNYVAIKEDISEKKRVEAELDGYRNHLESLVTQRTAELVAARDEANAANHAKSTFLATMSHEIRTPMNAIIGFSQLLQKKLSDPEHLKWLSRVVDAGKHLLAIINDVLDFSKIEAGKLVLGSGEVDVRAMTGQIITLLEQAAGPKGLRLGSEIGPRVPLRCVGDATRLTQAFLNIANNAVKFTDTGSVTLRVLWEDENADGVLLRFEVQDTGIGIAPGDHVRLFQPFQQADAGSTRSYGGTGLGLAITRRLAEFMGGHTGLVSAPGRGSTFWFTARLGKASAPGDIGPRIGASTAAEAELRQKFSGTPILLAEDDPINQEVARYQLEDVGLVVTVAEDGQQAVDRITAGDSPYALVLMDLQMPRMDGLDATRVLRARGIRLPIIAMTANAFAEDHERCLDAGMDDYLAKPVDPGRLYAVLLKWLAGRP